MAIWVLDVVSNKETIVYQICSRAINYRKEMEGWEKVKMIIKKPAFECSVLFLLQNTVLLLPLSIASVI